MTMFWIASITPSVGASAAQFTGIPQTFTHLQMRYFIRGSDAGTISFANVSINGNSYGTNYSQHTLGGNGASAYTTGSSNAGGIGDLYVPASSATANCFVSGILDLLDYTNTNKNKVIKTIHGYDANGSGYAILGGGQLLNTAAVTSLGIFNMTFTGNCRLDLYGSTTSSIIGA